LGFCEAFTNLRDFQLRNSRKAVIKTDETDLALLIGYESEINTSGARAVTVAEGQKSTKSYTQIIANVALLPAPERERER